MYSNSNDYAERLDLQLSVAGLPFQRQANVHSASFSIDDTGFGTTTWGLERDFNASWYDLAINSPCRYVPQYGDLSGDVGWEGFLSSVEPVLDRESASIVLTGLGRKAHNENLYFWNSNISSPPPLGGITGDTPENLIKYLLNNGLLPNLSSATTRLLTTGLTGKIYQSANGGSSEESVGAILTAICGWGTTITGQRIVPQVFEGGVLQTVGLPIMPTARYRISRYAIDKLGLSRNIMNVANRIIVKYNLNGYPDRIVQDDTDSQAAFGTSWPVPSSGFDTRNFVPFVRTHLVDITGLGFLPDNTLATNICQLILNQLKRLQNESSQAITVTKDFALYDLVRGCSVANWQVRPGSWVEVSELYPTNPLEFGTNTVLGFTNLFYISKTTYDCETGKLELTPEKSSAIADQIAQIGSGPTTNAGYY